MTQKTSPTRSTSILCASASSVTSSAIGSKSSAAMRYDELVRRHPEAFVDHAAGFWLTVGGDPQRGLRLVERDPTHSHAATTHSLLRRAPRAG